MRWIRPLAISAVLVLGAGCARQPVTGPPPLRLGEQECAACRMLISDERFAAALVYEHDGRVQRPAFDDINCLFGHLADLPAGTPYSVYTHDFETRAWLNARDAAFVRSSALESPMGAQIAAASRRVAAEQLLKRYPGEVLTYEQVAELFAPKAEALARRGGKSP